MRSFGLILGRDMATCPTCGEANPAHARFCLACGSSLEAEAPPREMRKTVTIVFCDITGSTPLVGKLDAEPYRRVISRYFIEVSRVLEGHGGTVEKFIGDAVMAVFGIPTVHEDDALRAVRAASELREAVGGLNEELRRQFDVELGIRIGVNTGEVVAGDPSEGQAFASGEAVTLTQRLQSSASPGEILLGDPTYQLVRNAVLVEPLDPIELKGKAEPVVAWRLLGVISGAPAVARRLDAPIVGRERELGVLRDAFDEAVRSRSCRMVTVVGHAGIGKSRLANELLATVRDGATALVGRCLPYGEGITYWPLRDIVRKAAGDLTQERIESALAGEEEAERIATRVAGAIGISGSVGAPDETMWAVRRLLERVAREQPLIVGFDDLQWAEPTLLDLIEYLVGWVQDAPVLIVCLARPELIDQQPNWAVGNTNRVTIRLDPLSDADAEALLDVLRGDADVSRDLLRRIRQAAEGNPLFAEQMLAMSLDETEPGAELPMPPSIHALLDARLDRLEPVERAAIERAAVVGRDFWRGAIQALSPAEERDEIGPALMALVRKELIHPHTSIFPEEDGFQFRHILIRDAAYLGMPKATRALLHVRYADWLERASGERARELDEILGYHLEQAFRYRQELGRVEAADYAIATRSGERLGEAGRRAIEARGDLSAAVNLISRAAALLPTDHALRRELLPELGSALIATGDFSRAEQVLTEALEAAAGAGDRSLELRTLVDREFLRAFTAPEGSIPEILATTEEVIPLLEELGDELGLAKAWWLKSEVHLNAARWGKRAEALERALEHARRAGDRREEATIVGNLALSLLYGPMPVPDAIRRCEQLLAEAEGYRSQVAGVAGALAALYAMQGEFDRARELWARSQAIYEELALRFRRALRSLIPAGIEMLAGDAEAAVRMLRWGYDALEEMGAKGARSTLAAYLADALCALGEYDEAERFTHVSEEIGAGEDVVTQIVWRSARARVLARRGERGHAETLARDALNLAMSTDFLDLQASTLVVLAEVLFDAESAVALLAEARTIYERKGNVVAAENVSRLPTATLES
jgi:class 3 adenylate cyclase/tetratricopeptide (TPR) repeat protein